MPIGAWAFDEPTDGVFTLVTAFAWLDSCSFTVGTLMCGFGTLMCGAGTLTCGVLISNAPALLESAKAKAEHVASNRTVWPAMTYLVRGCTNSSFQPLHQVGGNSGD